MYILSIICFKLRICLFKLLVYLYNLIANEDNNEERISLRDKIPSARVCMRKSSIAVTRSFNVYD